MSIGQCYHFLITLLASLLLALEEFLQHCQFDWYLIATLLVFHCRNLTSVLSTTSFTISGKVLSTLDDWDLSVALVDERMSGLLTDLCVTGNTLIISVLFNAKVLFYRLD